MNIFISGSGGFIGKALKEKLARNNIHISAPTSKECNLLNDDSLINFNHIKFEKIFHLASWTQAGDFCKKFQGDQWIINQKINTNILSWWKNNQKNAKLISIGTSTSYDPELPMVEENYLRGSPIKTFYSYAMSKRMLEVGLQSLSSQYNMDYLTIVPSTIYGPNYHNDGRQMHFIFDLIRKIMLGKYENKKVVLWGDGYQKREIVFIDDFIETLLKIDKLSKNQIVNVCAGKEYSIREFAKIICQIIDYDHNLIAYDTSKYVGARSKMPSIKKLKSIIPDYLENTKSLEYGIKEVIDWFNSINILKNDY
jgi:GDP-L-fucose synthase